MKLGAACEDVNVWKVEMNKDRNDAGQTWVRFILRSARWIMLGIICIAGANILLNVIDLLFRAHWSYSWGSLMLGLFHILLTIAIRRLAAWGLREL